MSRQNKYLQLCNKRVNLENKMNKEINKYIHRTSQKTNLEMLPVVPLYVFVIFQLRRSRYTLDSQTGLIIISKTNTIVLQSFDQ